MYIFLGKDLARIGMDEDVILAKKAVLKSKKQFDSNMNKMNDSSFILTKEKRRGFLCTIFLKLTPLSYLTLISNMKHTSANNFCDWAIVAYAGDSNLLLAIQKQAWLLNVKIIHSQMVSYTKMPKIMKKYWKTNVETGRQMLGKLYLCACFDIFLPAL